MNRKPEALIFDFDGVVADTEPLQPKPAPAPPACVCRRRGTSRTLPGANRS